VLTPIRFHLGDRITPYKRVRYPYEHLYRFSFANCHDFRSIFPQFPADLGRELSPPSTGPESAGMARGKISPAPCSATMADEHHPTDCFPTDLSSDLRFCRSLVVARGVFLVPLTTGRGLNSIAKPICWSTWRQTEMRRFLTQNLWTRSAAYRLKPGYKSSATQTHFYFINFYCIKNFLPYLNSSIALYVLSFC